jgi:hypothetical protein
MLRNRRRSCRLGPGFIIESNHIPSVGAAVPGGRPNAEAGGGRAAVPRSGAALILTIDKFGNY